MPKPKQKFIPGLNSRPDDVEMPPKQPEKTDLDYLIDEFKKQRKNAAMCLHEYCQKEKLTLKFEEGAVQFRPNQPHTFGKFGCRAIIDGRQYPQGVGANKKEAKIEASRLCFRAVVGLDDYVPEEVAPEIDDNRYVEVRDLLDICTAQDISYEKMMNQDQKGVHTCTVYLSNRDPIRHSSADREEAVVRAHREAIRILRSHAASDEPLDVITSSGDGAAVELPRIPNPEEAELREREAYAALEKTLSTLRPEIASYDHHIAAIFLSNVNIEEYSGIGRIVAFGTGNSTLNAEHLTPDYRCVADSTAPTTARRALKRYLGFEMVSCFKGGKSIFEKDLKQPGRLKLRVGFEFHLFLSHPPEGDYNKFLSEPSQFSAEEVADIARGAHFPTFTDDSHGLLTCRNEQGVIYSSAEVPEVTSQEDVKLSKSVWVMSESDKLLTWNILGIQGAVYSLFTHPIYLKDISLGFNANNDHGHLCRAVCCRVYPELSASFPAPYVVNHPILSFSPSRETRAMYDSCLQGSPHSLNWSVHDKMAEITDGRTGRSHPTSPFKVTNIPMSRQCKAGLHIKWFGDLSRLSLLVPGDKSPAETKALAQDYQCVKAALFEHCMENSLGKWVHVPQGQWKHKQYK